MEERVESSIKKTIVYFDLFDFPLTDWEIYKNLWQGPRMSFNAMQAVLLRLVAVGALEAGEGLYFLKHRSNLINNRKKRYLLAQKKMRRACFWARLIARLPFIRAVFVCNDLAYFNAPAKSDIDFAIIIAKGRIWFTRFFSAGLMALLRKRPTTGNRADKICLSFYCSEDSLNLRNLAYVDDIHFVYWLSQFVPLSGGEKVINRFYFENQWLREYLPNVVFPSAPRRWITMHRHLLKATMETLLSGFIGDVFEKLFKKIQLKILPARLAALARENSTDVVISDKILKLHDNDTRHKILNKWRLACLSE